MRQIPAEFDPRPVLARYDLASQPTGIQFLGNRGGFSGAHLWRIEWSSGTGCLRAWPPSDDLADRLAFQHPLILLARRRDLRFVPTLFPTRTGDTWVSFAGRLWDLAEWLPGVAEFHAQPTTARLEAACTAVAQLHHVWAATGCRNGPCPAVERRFDAWKNCQRLTDAGWTPSLNTQGDDAVTPLVSRAWALVQHHMELMPAMLEPWRHEKMTLSPCLCDVWHDHLLFDGDRLTGLIDYGEVKIDHPAVDLARMLGSLVGDSFDGWSQGTAAYRQVRPLSDEEILLAAVLDRTGIIIGMWNWLRWLYRDERMFDDRDRVAARLRSLVERVERWH